jgi:hypothetical protein
MHVKKTEFINGKKQEYVVPVGKSLGNQWGYSEYIVYNTNQVRMKYLVRVKVN